jgi:hypothetical protein
MTLALMPCDDMVTGSLSCIGTFPDPMAVCHNASAMDLVSCESKLRPAAILQYCHARQDPGTPRPLLLEHQAAGELTGS